MARSLGVGVLSAGLVLTGSVGVTAAPASASPAGLVSATDPVCPPRTGDADNLAYRLFWFTPSRVQSGGTLRVEKLDQWCGTRFELVLLPGEIRLGTLVAGPTHKIKGTLTIPGSVKPGAYQVAERLFDTDTGRKILRDHRPIIISGGPGSMAQVALSPSLTGSRHGDVLALDWAGALWRYPASGSGQLGRGSQIGSGFADFRLYPPGDWDGDAKADLIAVKAGQMFLYRGDGKGGLARAEPIGRGWAPYRVIPTGDLTGDGVPDMLAIHQGSGALLLYSGNGRGGFKPGYRQVGHGWRNMQLFAAGDLNRDGRADILGVSSDGRLFFYAGKGDGSFRAAQQVGRGWKGLDLVAGADLNGDAVADICARTSGGVLNLYPGRGGGSFAAPVQIGKGF